MTSGSHGRSQTNAPTTDDWVTLSDELIQGLVHALNNRVASLSAFVELARFGDDEANPVTFLPAEIEQLHRVNGLFALLPERGSDPEALELPLVLDDALRLHEHHPRLRNERCVVVREGTPLPVRAPRWALLRVLVMLVHAAKRDAESVQGRGGAPIRVTGDASMVAVFVTSRVNASASLRAVAALCGGTVEREEDEIVLRVPSILELRRRERSAEDHRADDRPV